MTVANPAGAALRERIPRRQLSRRTRDALERGSLLVMADVGFGKTLAIEEALDGWRRAARVARTEADREPGHLMTALRRAFPGAVDVLAERLTVGVGAVDPAVGGPGGGRRTRPGAGEPAGPGARRRGAVGGPKGAAIQVVAELMTSRSRYGVAIGTRQDLSLKMAKPRAKRPVTRSAQVLVVGEAGPNS